MAEYSRAELENMQREAERRVAEMQQRARKNLNWESFGSATEKNGRNNPYSSSKNQNTRGFSPRQETSSPPTPGSGQGASFTESTNRRRLISAGIRGITATTATRQACSQDCFRDPCPFLISLTSATF